jgi:hypothetical protein
MISSYRIDAISNSDGIVIDVYFCTYMYCNYTFDHHFRNDFDDAFDSALIFFKSALFAADSLDDVSLTDGADGVLFAPKFVLFRIRGTSFATFCSAFTGTITGSGITGDPGSSNTSG